MRRRIPEKSRVSVASTRFRSQSLDEVYDMSSRVTPVIVLLAVGWCTTAHAEERQYGHVDIHFGAGYSRPVGQLWCCIDAQVNVRLGRS